MSGNYPFNDRMRSIKVQIITLAAVLALLVVGMSAQRAFADRKANQMQSLEQSTSTCGEKAAEPDSTTLHSPGTDGAPSTDSADPSTQSVVQDDGVSAGSNAEDANDEEETVPARPFDGRPR
jgi:hypothetical protein